MPGGQSCPKNSPLRVRRSRPARWEPASEMKQGIVTRPAWWKLVMVLSGLALLVVACGSSGGTPSSSTPAAPSSSAPAAPSSSAPASPATSPLNAAACADAAALRASLDKLKHVKVGKGTVNEIKADLKDVQTNLTALVNDAVGQWQAQINALKSALANLQTAVKTLAANFSASAVSGVVTAIGGVSTAGQNLLAVVSTRCPSASPTSSA